MYKNRRIGIVIPCYNEERFIRGVIEEMPSFADRIYTIDDGSRDNTADVVKSLSDPRVTLIRHGANKGLGAAITTGYKAALKDGVDIIVKLDGDGQMPADYIESLLIPLVEGKADYTKGDRLSNLSDRKGMPRMRLFGNLLLTWLSRIATGYWHLSDPQNGFTAISKKALEDIKPDTLYSFYGNANDVLVRLNINNFKIQDVPMPSRYGEEKSSIKYRTYIPKVSLLLLRRFVWRLWKKYIKRGL